MAAIPEDTAIELRQPLQASSSSPAQAPTETTDQYPTGIRFVILTIGLILSIFLAALDSSIISTAIPKITNQFGTVADVGWYSSAYAITNAAFQSTWGKAYKHFSIRVAFSLAIFIFELGNIISATAHTSPFLIFGRVVAGTGGGGIMTGSFIVIAFSAKPAYRAAYMGVLGVTFGCASVVGPLLGGILTDGPGWPWCFWINLPIGITAVTILLLSFSPPQSALPPSLSLKQRIYSLDLSGSFLILSALTTFVFATQSSTTHTWTSIHTIIPITLSAILTLAFIYNEHQLSHHALIQSHLLHNRRIIPNLIFSFLIAGLFFPLSYILPIQFQAVLNASASQSGLRLIPLILGVSVFTMIANGILTFWKHYTPFLLIGAMCATVGVVMMHTLPAEASVASWIGFEIFTASGVGLALQIPMIANQAAVGVEDIASVTSLTLLSENIGQALFIAASEAALTNGLAKSLNGIGGVKPEDVIHTGATEIRGKFGKEEIPQIIASYLKGCRDSQWIPIACGIAAVGVSVLASVPGVKREMGRWRKQEQSRER